MPPKSEVNMTHILSPKQMQEIDRKTMDEFGIPSRVLMETAGARCADAIMQYYSDVSDYSVLILCGTGNNGGDGYVIARHLSPFVKQLLIVSLGKANMSQESLLNRELCQKMNIRFLEIGPDADALDALPSADLLVDCLFGIGFKGELPDFMQHALTSLCNKCRFKVAIDIPSGLNAQNGLGGYYKADLTLAIENLKYGHLLNDGPCLCGDIKIIRIGIPLYYKSPIKTYLQSHAELPKRPQNAHKGNFGRVFIFGGRPGYVGSARLSAKAALYSGAGLIHLFSRKDVIAHYTAFADEIMNFAIPEDTRGMPDEGALIESIAKADAIAIGPGMGVDEYARDLLRIVLDNAKCPVLADADAITLLAQNPKLLPLLSKGIKILSPHPLEFCRLADIDLDTLKRDPVQQISKLHSILGCDILLKGHCSLYACAEGIFFIHSGNDALATGGSGDVLSGIIASFIAQKSEPCKAAPSASFLMGKTAEYLCKTRRSFSITPTDIIEHLGDTNV